MWQSVIEGFVLGIQTGTVCLMTCTPIYLPYLMTEDRSIMKSMLAVMEISAGRFFSYLLFGALAGLAGASISSINRHFFSSIAYIILTVYMLLTVFRTHRNEKSCFVPKVIRITKSAFLLGVLTGINFCPSFLIALSGGIESGGVITGILLFLGFFFGTTLYLIPLGFAGGLTQITYLKKIARILSVLVAIWFFYKGGKGLYEYFNADKISEDRLVEAFEPGKQIIIISTEDNLGYFTSLRDSVIFRQNITPELKTDFPENIEIKDNSLLFIDAYFYDSYTNKTLIRDYDCIIIEKDYSINKIITFLNSHVFKSEKKLEWNIRNQ